MIRNLLMLFSVLLLSQVMVAQINPSLDYSKPRKYEVTEVVTHGLEYLDEGAVIAITGIRVGDRIDIPGGAVLN